MSILDETTKISVQDYDIFVGDIMLTDNPEYIYLQVINIDNENIYYVMLNKLGEQNFSLRSSFKKQGIIYSLYRYLKTF